MRWFFLTHKGLVMIGGSVLVLMFLALWERHQMIQTGYAIEQQKRVNHRLRRAHQTLMAERESLSHLARIERLAQKQLGMVHSSGNEKRTLTERGERLGAPGEKETARVDLHGR